MWSPAILIQLAWVGSQVVLGCSHWLKSLVQYKPAQVFERVRISGFRTEGSQSKAPYCLQTAFVDISPSICSEVGVISTIDVREWRLREVK